MPGVHSKAARVGLAGRSLGAAGMLSLILVVYSYVQHRKAAAKARKSMAALAAALSTASMRNLHSANTYTADRWIEADERERRFDADAPHFKCGPMGVAADGKRAKLDREFLRQLRAIRRIVIPSLASKEAAIIGMHAVFLVLRTWLSVVVAELDGKIVKHLVQGHGRRFLAGLLSWFAIAIPATYTNSMIRFLESKLALSFRTRLTQYVHDLYLNENLNYYKLQALDSRIAHPDQFITADIARFCNKVASFLSNLGKPTLDAVIFNIQLVRGVGLPGTVGMFGMYLLTAQLLRAWTPPFGKMAAEQASLEGDFRAHHARVITNAEEIAFYRGEKRESEQVQGSLKRLLSHARSIARRKVPHVVLEDMVIKYTWSAFGYLACALPFFIKAPGGAAGRDGGSGFRTQRFITNKRILVNLSEAGGRMMYSIKEIMELTGYTSRVYSLLSTLHALRRDEYERAAAVASGEQGEFALSKAHGMVYEDIDGVRLTGVPIVAPAADGGELLVRPLTWEVRRGEHWMVAGPNGVGKTSVLRVLSGLWPAFAGVVERPQPSEIIYIPQRAYLPLGSLRDQIIYPHTHAQMQAAGRTDDELMEVLSAVHLAYLPAREGGLAARKEWKDVLSGGEKQRINLARMFYHLPRFAVLDECTSAVSADVEGLMYEHAKRLGITLITISHRPSLYKYHTYLLRLGVHEADSQQTVSSVLLDELSDAPSSSRNSGEHSLSTESWVDDVAASGVLWDVVQLSTAAGSATTSPASSPPLPALAVPRLRPEPSSASTSRIDIARESLADANRGEMQQLRSALATKNAHELRLRLDCVQRELAAASS
ncbi:ATP-binding cassette long-chain fatty acid transporter pxa1 [Coemansia sp. RSA 989]|nr:ATP-binding cassette long-chain fatty acid transporter pxa1 [Coemansia sp. RSA 1086]KAJ1752207.1 ATP-binding cassette long-chain fatty acid transporter pxa1 [Coemansia sp. RSA 1821]KAJ1867351.1 ATP-binding cassette long-chain fatty acid transporter pxa1 [Coemansia sp. RSA 989]KAJ1873804.1 ATP-binding cassette long-chain fatty acid transporter pxa1 [Coemansia sp. RSA 990]